MEEGEWKKENGGREVREGEEEEIGGTHYFPSAMMPLTVPWAVTMGARRPRPRRVKETILSRSSDMLI